MTHCRDMTTPELIRALTDSKLSHIHPRYRLELICDLVKRLEQEYQRTEKHKDKLTRVTQDYVAHRTRAATAERKLAEYEHSRTGYIKVAKPHIRQVFTVPGNHGMWRCTGVFGTVQYGGSPREAYAAWRRVMERGKVWRN